MGIANFGAFLGGMTQGAQNAEAQRERAAYLLMLQKREKDAEDDRTSTRQALFDNDLGAGLATDPFAGAPPPPRQQPPMPGQASTPMMQPPGGALPPQPQAPQSAYPPGGRPMVAPVPQAVPQPGAAPMPQAQPQQAAMPPQSQPGGPMPAPQPQGAQDGFARADAMLSRLNAQMETPIAQKVMNDPSVKQATDAFHAYAKELRDAGISPGGGQKPDAVQMKRLNLLHQQVELATTEAAKHVTTDVQSQVKIGTEMANVWVKQETLKQQMKMKEEHENRVDARADKKAAGGGGGSGVGGVAKFDDMDDATKTELAEQYMKLGPSVMPWARSAKGGSEQIGKFMGWMAQNGFTNAAGERAGYKSDQASLTNLTKNADIAVQRFRALDKNVDLMLGLAQKYGLKGNQPLNAAANFIRTKGGSADAVAYQEALNTVQREYGKLAEGGSGAAAAHVSSIENAAKILGANFTYDQLQSAAKTLKSDGQNIVDAWNDQIRQSKQRTGASARKGGSSAAPAPSAGGQVVTRAAVQAYAKQKGMSEAAVEKQLKDAGATIGE